MDIKHRVLSRVLIGTTRAHTLSQRRPELLRLPHGNLSIGFCLCSYDNNKEGQITVRRNYPVYVSPLSSAICGLNAAVSISLHQSMLTSGVKMKNFRFLLLLGAMGLLLFVSKYAGPYPRIPEPSLGVSLLKGSLNRTDSLFYNWTLSFNWEGWRAWLCFPMRTVHLYSGQSELVLLRSSVEWYE
jgi:hypothetical protein